MNQNIIDAFDEFYNIYNTRCRKFIQREEFIDMLPDYLQRPGTTKLAMVNELPKRVTEKHLLEILLTMHNGYEYMSFYYLFKKYGKFNDVFRYRGIKQEAYYIYIILENLTKDPFISQYINHDIMNFIFQDKIELLVLPSVNQFKFDKCFPRLNIILEINEYTHEAVNTKENDTVKESLAVLCGMSLSSLKIKEIFGGITSHFYKKLSDIELHETLQESQYLRGFLAGFNVKILSSLLKDNVIRNDYIMYEFKNILNRKLIFLYNRFDNTFKQSGKYSESDKLLIKNMKGLIDTVNTSKDFLKIFKLKDKCVKSDSGYAITFSEICELLKFDKEDAEKFIEFKKFLFEETDMVTNIAFVEQTHLFSWECMYTIVIEYKLEQMIKTTLKMYLLYVGKTYEMVVKMINSHSKNLISDKHKLSIYINRFKESFHKKIQDENESLKKKNSDLTEINAMYKKYFPDSHFDKDLNYTANNATRIDFTENLEERVERMNLLYNDIINSDSNTKSEVIKEIIEESDPSDSDY
jgi:hypothetical protein